MILTDKDAIQRLNSPQNLINKLTSGRARNAAMSLFGVGNSATNRVAVTASSSAIESQPASPPRQLSSFLQKPDIPSKEEVKETIVSFNPFQKTALTVEKKESISLQWEPPKPPKVLEEIIPVKLDDLLDDGNTKIKLSLAHDTALQTLTESVQMLRSKLDDIKADKLPSVITATSKVVESIRRERVEINKGTKGKEVHYHFYTPEQKRLTDYEIIEVQ